MKDVPRLLLVSRIWTRKGWCLVVFSAGVRKCEWFLQAWLISILILPAAVIDSVSTLAYAGETSQVRYTCSAEKGVIEIHLAELGDCLEGGSDIWSGKPVPWEQSQIIQADKDSSSGTRYSRNPGEPIRYECDLRWGRYLVTFGAH